MITHTLNADEFIPKYNAVSVNSGGRVVNTNWPDAVSVSNYFGIALNEGTAGTAIQVCIFGVVTNPDWSFEPLKPVHAYYTGSVTQKVLGSSILVLGKAISPTSLYTFPSNFMMLM